MRATLLAGALAGCSQVVTLGSRPADAAGEVSVDGGMALIDAAQTDSIADTPLSDETPPDVQRERVRLFRCHGSSGFDCSVGGRDWDHCFSLSPMTCQCVDAAGADTLRWEHDHTSLSVYKYDTNEADTVRVGADTLHKLYGCYDPFTRERRYVLWDHTIRQREGIDCRPVGYVAKSSTLAGDAEPVRETHLPLVSDLFYALASHEDNPGAACRPSTPRVVWWAWR